FFNHHPCSAKPMRTRTCALLPSSTSCRSSRRSIGTVTAKPSSSPIGVITATWGGTPPQCASSASTRHPRNPRTKQQPWTTIKTTATNIATISVRNPVALGYLAALTAVFITAVYPALTRLSVTTTLTPADLLLFRLGGSGLLFVPFLVMHAHEIPKADWLAGLPLSFLHGWGMAGCVVFGLL